MMYGKSTSTLYIMTIDHVLKSMRCYKHTVVIMRKTRGLLLEGLKTLCVVHHLGTLKEKVTCQLHIIHDRLKHARELFTEKLKKKKKIKLNIIIDLVNA